MTWKAALWRLVIAGVATTVMLIAVANVITQPVTSPTRAYSAKFTDASGLHTDADVRVRGVRVGKVQSIELHREQDQSTAAVKFTLDKQYGVVSTTRLAIKFQALTGVRYLDVLNPSERYSTTDLVTDVPTVMTQPSFDVTALFNGLQPVIATLSPEEVNTFTTNAASYLAGDGEGLEPILDSIHKLTAFVSDRQHVIATLMRNLSEIADTMGGHSRDLVKILDSANLPLDGALSVIEEFRKSKLFGYEFTHTAAQLLRNVGLKFGANMDNAFDRALGNLDDFTEAFKLVPVMWDDVPPPAGAPAPCSRGRAELPAMLNVLLNGQRVVLCNP
ncbi:MlaD family protein [Mycobacterium arosiense]|uniref:Mammalian cell entry protein n=1 Tax=Mycobacterium arosiense ATCC BAA-1401 = DSM 45069 TaxID=1265311 RepID=A0A1W9ZBQ0_MYCAI|nr:MlaD family protein [Mycobacterium arosiense]ORA11290.1 mammalian cell entry protein [Mycobacterium arosiense ATCC BAA-1401 = DSM 45069]